MPDRVVPFAVALLFAAINAVVIRYVERHVASDARAWLTNSKNEDENTRRETALLSACRYYSDRGQLVSAVTPILVGLFLGVAANEAFAQLIYGAFLVAAFVAVIASGTLRPHEYGERHGLSFMTPLETFLIGITLIGGLLVWAVGSGDASQSPSDQPATTTSSTP